MYEFFKTVIGREHERHMEVRKFQSVLLVADVGVVDMECRLILNAFHSADYFPPSICHRRNTHRSNSPR